MEVRFVMPHALLVAFAFAAFTLVSNGRVEGQESVSVAVSMLLMVVGLVTGIGLLRSGRFAEPALELGPEGLRINRPLNRALLRWCEIDTAYVDPPDAAGYLASKSGVTIEIFAEDGRVWNFGAEELAAEPWQMAEFAERVVARAHGPAAMRKS
jgi:hypothetical protein